MNAGRELDALVAEKIFGFKLFDHGGSPWVELPNNECDRLPDYSTDISAALPIFEKFHQREIHIVRGYDITIDRDRWICQIRLLYKELFEGCALTAPHAICLAALKAVSGA